MTEREKIINLAKKCTKPDTVDCYHNGHFTLDAEELETFYHAAIADFINSSGLTDTTREACIKQARDEALEEAAKLCVIPNGMVMLMKKQFLPANMRCVTQPSVLDTSLC